MIKDKKETIYIWGSSANYSRTEVIMEGFKDNNFNIIDHTYAGKSILSKIKLFQMLFKIPKYSYVYIPSMNHINSIIAKFSNYILRKKHYIIFDPLISRYDTLVMDRKKHKENSLMSRLDFMIDRHSMNWVNCVLADTLEHKDYFIEHFNIEPNKIIEVPVGAPKIFLDQTIKSEEKSEFNVIFYGNFIPLHGIDTILKAFDMLRDYPIKLTLVGNGQTYNEMKKLSRNLELENVEFIERLPYKELIELLTKSDLGLGVFGKSNKASRVVPNKIYQMGALGLPIITQNSDSVKRAFGKNIVYVKAGDYASLANEIILAQNSKELFYQKGINLKKISVNEYTPSLITKKIIEYIEKSSIKGDNS